MSKSMTGYGSYRQEDQECLQFWEIKSVNSRHLNLKWKLPGFLQFMEPAWEGIVRSYALRGSLEIRLNWKILRSEDLPLSINRSYLEVMLNQISFFATQRGETFQPDYNMLLKVPNIWQETSLRENEELVRIFENGLKHALADWDSARLKEGDSITFDIENRLNNVKLFLQDLENRDANLAEEKFAALQNKVNGFLQYIREEEVPQDRMLQEFALMAEKFDISEEIARISTHVNTLLEYLKSDQVGGRNLDFLLQECFREINTCGNKAQDTEVSRLAVDIKTELEKCREQVQNLE